MPDSAAFGKISANRVDLIELSDRLPAAAPNLSYWPRHDGTLLLANFLPGLPDAGYMELCMDWLLIYRSRSQIGISRSPVRSSADESKLHARTGKLVKRSEHESQYLISTR